MVTNYAQIFARQQNYKKKWLELDVTIPDASGIYILTREDNGFKFAYIGQAKKILTRLAQHLDGHDQHIDLSLKKHKLYNKEANPTGWNVEYHTFAIDKLDEMEQYFIKVYANAGYQLRNVTAGGQGEGKFGIADNKPSKGYRDGVAYGKKKIAKELKDIIDKYLVIGTKDTTKRATNALEKFWEILKNCEN